MNKGVEYLQASAELIAAAAEQLGFSRDRKIGKHRWVVTRVVERQA